jgi:hypothetical protein
VVDRSRHLRERDTTARVMLAALVPAMFRSPSRTSARDSMVIAVVMLFVAGSPGDI